MMPDAIKACLWRFRAATELRSLRRNPIKLAQLPTKSPKCRRKTTNCQGMQVYDLFCLKIHACIYLKLNNLWPHDGEWGFGGNNARRRTTCDPVESDRYHFCFVRVTGQTVSIIENSRNVSS